MAQGNGQGGRKQEEEDRLTYVTGAWLFPDVILTPLEPPRNRVESPVEPVSAPGRARSTPRPRKKRTAPPKPPINDLTTRVLRAQIKRTTSPQARAVLQAALVAHEKRLREEAS